MKVLTDWVEAQKVSGLHMKVHREGDRTPLLFIEVEPTTANLPTVLLYGHMDKQPPFQGWHEGLDPYKPVMRDGKLYGRGGADDGYAVFSALTAIMALQEQGIAHGRCVILIEACEESGSFDLPFYINHLKSEIGIPNLIVCLDSGAGDYSRMWLTTSLRGMVVGDLSVQISTEGVHSGDASGIVADSFRIARHVLSRLEDPETGRILPPELHVEIPAARIAQVEATVAVMGDEVWNKFPFVPGARPVGDANVERALNRAWRPQLAVTGAAGLPPLASAGNVLRPSTTLKLSLRIPPSMPGPAASAVVKALLEKDPPYGAKVVYEAQKSGTGWNSPALAPWLSAAAEDACLKFFGKPLAFQGEGGSIPFMGMLGELYPQAQFIITGVLGPASNAHGPNEFLHIPFAKNITNCVALILAAHASS